jgi:hypothetical protein
MKVLPRLSALFLLTIGTAAMTLLAPVFLAGKALFWGTPLLQFVPWWSWAWESLLSGRLPFWNPLVGMGAPLLANYQSALVYPPYWIYFGLYLLGGVPLMAWGQAILVALHLAWAGIGMAWLARRLGLGSLSGLAFGLSGYLVSRAGFLSINAAAAWTPWVILCLTPDKRHPGMTRLRFMALALCMSVQMLAGHAQTTWYTLLLGGMWAGFWAWGAGYREISSAEREATATRLKRLGRDWGWLALATLLAACLAAAQLLPTAEYLAQSQRSQAVDFEYAMNYSFWPWHLITLLAPDMFGNPATGDYWGYANYWEDAIYVGVLPLLLAIGVLLSGLWNWMKRLLRRESQEDRRFPDQRNRLAAFLFLVFVLALLFALGKHTPILPWLYRHVPTFDMFQAPARYMLWAVFALALLAGLGAESWRRPEGRALYWTRLGSAGAFAVSLGAGLAWYFMGDISPTFIRATALAGMWGLGAGLLSLTAPVRVEKGSVLDQPGAEEGWPGKLWRCGVACFVAVDLIVAGWGLNPGVDPQVYRASKTARQVAKQLDGKRIFLPAAYEEIIKYERFLRFDTFDPGQDWQALRETFLPNVNMLDGLHSTNNFDPLVPGRYADWMDILPKVPKPTWERMLNLMDVGLVEVLAADEPYGVRFMSFEGGGRVRWLPCARYVRDGKAALEQVLAAKFDEKMEVILEAAPPPISSQCELPGTAIDQSQARILAETPGRVVVVTQTPAPGWLLLSDVWYPGWRATVDGRAAEVLRADYLFRAIRLEAGAHQIVFAYRPLSFWLGACLSLIAWIGLAVWRRPPGWLTKILPGGRGRTGA